MEEKNEQEVIDVDSFEESPLALTLYDENFDEVKALEIAKKRLKFFSELRKMTLSETNEEDWVRLVQKGKESFYLQASGAKKLAGPWGIYWKNVKLERIKEDGKIHYEVSGVMGCRVLGREIEVFGGRSASDKFFTDQENLDILDVKKSAWTNWVRKGVMVLLGLENIPGEELKKYGIDISNVQGFKFKEGFKKKDDSELSDDAKGKRKKIGEMLMEMANDDKEVAADLLRSFTEFENKEGKKVGGRSSTKDLSAGQIPVVYGKVKDAYEAEFAGAKDE